jgi:hypothetical protein
MVYKLIKNEIDEYVCEVQQTQSAMMDCLKTYSDKITLLEQQVKDGLQSNALCCKLAVENIKEENNRLSAWCAKLANLLAEKQLSGIAKAMSNKQDTEYKYTRKDNQKHGSIEVVIPQPNKDKSHESRRSTTKSK